MLIFIKNNEMGNKSYVIIRWISILMLIVGHARMSEKKEKHMHEHSSAGFI